MASNCLTGCLIKTKAFSVMKNQGAMATITSGQSRTRMCVKLRDLDCHSYTLQIAVYFALTLWLLDILCGFLTVFKRDCPISRCAVTGTD